MAKPLSEDLRSRLVAAVDGDLSRRAAAERFGVSAASAARWVQAWRANGLTRAKPQGGDMLRNSFATHHRLWVRRPAALHPSRPFAAAPMNDCSGDTMPLA